MATGIRKRYEALRNKHKLPAFDELDSEFEIGSIDPESFSLREVRHKICDRIGDVRSLLDEVLHPDTNLVDLYESRVFDEDEKKQLFELYRQLMIADRTAAELSILNDEKSDAAFIKSFTADWKNLKKEAVGFIRRLREAWEKETEERDTAGYMG